MSVPQDVVQSLYLLDGDGEENIDRAIVAAMDEVELHSTQFPNATLNTDKAHGGNQKELVTRIMGEHNSEEREKIGIKSLECNGGAIGVAMSRLLLELGMAQEELIRVQKELEDSMAREEEKVLMWEQREDFFLRKLKDSTAAMDSLQERLIQVEIEVVESKGRETEALQRENAKTKEVESLTVEMGKTVNNLDVSASEISLLQLRVAEKTSELAQLHNQLRDAQSEAQMFKSDIASLGSQLEHARSAESELACEVSRLKVELHSQKQHTANKEQKLRDLLEETVNKDLEIQTLEEKLADSDKKTFDLKRAKEELEGDMRVTAELLLCMEKQIESMAEKEQAQVISLGQDLEHTIYEKATAVSLQKVNSELQAMAALLLERENEVDSLVSNQKLLLAEIDALKANLAAMEGQVQHEKEKLTSKSVHWGLVEAEVARIQSLLELEVSEKLALEKKLEGVSVLLEALRSEQEELKSKLDDAERMAAASEKSAVACERQQRMTTHKIENLKQEAEVMFLVPRDQELQLHVPSGVHGRELCLCADSKDEMKALLAAMQAEKACRDASIKGVLSGLRESVEKGFNREAFASSAAVLEWQLHHDRLNSLESMALASLGMGESLGTLCMSSVEDGWEWAPIERQEDLTNRAELHGMAMSQHPYAAIWTASRQRQKWVVDSTWMNAVCQEQEELRHLLEEERGRAESLFKMRTERAWMEAALMEAIGNQKVLEIEVSNLRRKLAFQEAFSGREVERSLTYKDEDDS